MSAYLLQPYQRGTSAIIYSAILYSTLYTSDKNLEFGKISPISSRFVLVGEGLLHSKPVQGIRLTNYITGFTPNQLIETSVYFRLVRHKSSDVICQICVQVRDCF